MRARLAILLLVALASTVIGPAAGASPAQDAEATPGRLLVVALPALEWREVASQDLPNLEAFFASASIADMAPRGVAHRSDPGAAYLTMSAGTRATASGTVDGQVLALEEHSGGSTAGEIFARRTGVVPDGEYVALSWPALVRANDRQPYDAVLGLLQATLAEHGVRTNVIGNADGTDTSGLSYERQVGLAVADTDGVVEEGSLGKELLVADATSPFGVRMDQEVVMQRFGPAWAAAAPHDGRPGGMVLVEASDLARVVRYRSLVDGSRYAQMRDRAIEAADELFGRLMAEVDPERDTVLVLAPYNRPGDRDLVVVALRRPGSEPGYLTSASMQRTGLLTLVDIAPTILNTWHIDRPVDMEGRRAEVVETASTYDERVERLVTINEASRFREKLLDPTTLAVLVVLLLLTAAAALTIAFERTPRWGRFLAPLALFDLAIFPASYLARGFPLEDLGIGFYWAFVLAFSLAVAAAATWAGRALQRPRLGLVIVLTLLAVVLAADVMTGSHLSLSAAFGYSPTGNSRLYGISNYSYGQVAAATCLLAALLAARPWRRSRLLAIGLLVATLVVLGVPVWGSDVGGVLAFTPTVLVFAALVYRRRVRLRTVVVGLVATAVAIVAFGFLDLARPPESRAHLGRLFERVGEEGLGPLWSISERKLLANLEVSTSSLWVAAIPIALAFWVFLVRYPGRPVLRLVRRMPTLRIGLLAALVAAGLGSAANDSGAIVGGVSAAVITAALVHLAMEPPAPVADPEAP